MAATRTRGFLPSGSIQWVNDENAQVEKHCEQEIEDFGFSARNEFDWLNEHMHDIFAKDQTNVIEIFKTPGKLRGKTPRTGRKRTALEAREPLTDVFVNNTPKAHPVFSIQSKSPAKTATFKVAEDTTEPSRATLSKNANTDSGYHGSEDEMDIDQTLAVATQDNFVQKSPPQEVAESTGSPIRSGDTDSQPKKAEQAENLTKAANTLSRAAVLEDNEAKTQDEFEEGREKMPLANGYATKGIAADDDDFAIDESHTSSRGSTPAKNLVRKSSLTFAALPAREPLTTKKSIGTRLSRTSNLDQLRTSMQLGATSGRFTGGKSLGASQHSLDDADDGSTSDTDTRNKPTLMGEESDGDSRIMQLHNKSSTQRLHERINLLGKSQSIRPTKSIPATSNVTRLDNGEMPLADSQAEDLQISVLQTSVRGYRAVGEDEDDWIQPPQPVHGQQRPELSPKSGEALANTRIDTKQADQRLGQGQEDLGATATMTQYPPAEQTDERFNETSNNQQALIGSRFSAGVQDFEEEEEELVDGGNWQVFDSSTTPPISPTAKGSVDGPLSASKYKLQSIMQTARGLFSSSAGASAQAKMETLSPNAAQQRNHQQPSLGGPEAAGSIAKAKENQVVIQESMPIIATVSDGSATRRVRRSADKGVQRTGQEHAKQAISEAERSQSIQNEFGHSAKEACEPARSAKNVSAPAKSVRQSPRKPQHQEGNAMPEANASMERKPAIVAPPQTQGRQSQISRPKDPRRPMKPAKELLSKPKPQPVAIRVGTLSTQRIPLTNTNLSASLQESLAPPQPKQAAGTGTKKPSLQSSVSSTGLKSQPNFAKPKALIAAEKKKEQDEKEAQRKFEQKRETERRKAAQQEEARLQEQTQRQEFEKHRQRERAAAAEDSKRVAQREAIEKRRMDLKHKDQPRVPAGPSGRHGLEGARPPSRQQNTADHSQPVNTHHPVNPPKAPIKRVFDPEADDAPTRTRPQQAGPTHAPHDSKRRKTEDSEPEDFPMRPTHAPPVRQSNIRKDGLKPSIFSNSHAGAPPLVAHHQHATSLLKSTTQSQAFQQHTAYQSQASRPGHHPDIKQYAQNGAKIPFAEHPNPASVNTQAQQPTNAYKTPFQSKIVPPKTASPQYQNGENIQLDDIPTDSEDGSESDDEPTKAKPTNLPEWAQSPNLRNLLETQEERMDADTVFGPVASPRMEEMFKERHHRFRSRTSSANWAGADRLTEEEIRRDVEARQRLRRDGGWTFGL